MLRFLKCDYEDCYLTDIWANVNRHGHGHVMHTHPVNYLSGVYYVNVPAGPGRLVFADPRQQSRAITPRPTENTPFNGPLMLVPGSHRVFVSCVGRTPEKHFETSLKNQQYGVPADDMLARLVDEGGIEAPTGPAGSVTFFDCNTMHGSASNITPMPRTNVFFVYNSVENRLGEPYSGREPRPDFLANRTDCVALKPVL